MLRASSNASLSTLGQEVIRGARTEDAATAPRHQTPLLWRAPVAARERGAGGTSVARARERLAARAASASAHRPPRSSRDSLTSVVSRACWQGRRGAVRQVRGPRWRPDAARSGRLLVCLLPGAPGRVCVCGLGRRDLARLPPGFLLECCVYCA